MSGPVSPDNQSLVGVGALAYGAAVIAGSYWLAKYKSSDPPQKTDEATDRTPPLSSTTP